MFGSCWNVGRASKTFSAWARQNGAVTTKWLNSNNLRTSNLPSDVRHYRDSCQTNTFSSNHTTAGSQISNPAGVMRGRDISCLCFLISKSVRLPSTEPWKANFPPTQGLTHKAEAHTPRLFSLNPKFPQRVAISRLSRPRVSVSSRIDTPPARRAPENGAENAKVSVVSFLGYDPHVRFPPCEPE